MAHREFLGSQIRYLVDTPDGQIIVDTQDQENVRLILDGVDIACSTSAPICVVNAEKTFLTLADGAENVVADGETYVFPDAASDEPNAAIFSHDDLTINGNGSLTVSSLLHEHHGLNVIGVPKTIDNDIEGTDITFGFNTAVQIATDAIDRLHTTAESHDRVLVVEVMGRHVGHIAAWAGLAGGAAVTLVPEEPFDMDEVARRISLRHNHGRWASIVVVAEGAVPAPGTIELPELPVDAYGHQVLGGIAHRVASELENLTGIESRTTVLGHVQRGGTPVAFDRVLATRFGVAAVDAVADRAFGDMVALQADQIVRVPVSEAVAHLKVVDRAMLRTTGIFQQPYIRAEEETAP